MEKTTRSEPTPEEIKRGYEVGDVSLKQAVWITVAFIVFGIVTHIFLTIVWKVTYRIAEQDDVPRSAIVDERPPRFAPPLQPSPYHDTTPAQDMTRMREDEKKVFESIGWKINDKTQLPTLPDAVVQQVASRPGQGTTRPAGGTR